MQKGLLQIGLPNKMAPEQHICLAYVHGGLMWHVVKAMRFPDISRFMIV